LLTSLYWLLTSFYYLLPSLYLLLPSLFLLLPSYFLLLQVTFYCYQVFIICYQVSSYCYQVSFYLLPSLFLFATKSLFIQSNSYIPYINTEGALVRNFIPDPDKICLHQRKNIPEKNWIKSYTVHLYVLGDNAMDTLKKKKKDLFPKNSNYKRKMTIVIF